MVKKETIEKVIYDSTIDYKPKEELERVGHTIYLGNQDILFNYLQKNKIQGNYTIELKITKTEPKPKGSIEEALERR